MISVERGAVVAGIAAVQPGPGGCAGMSTRNKNTAVGAAIGGVAGFVLSNGSAVGTVGDAVVGGVIGNEVGRHR